MTDYPEHHYDMLKTLKMALKCTGIHLPYILIRNKYFDCTTGNTSNDFRTNQQLNVS